MATLRALRRAPGYSPQLHAIIPPEANSGDVHSKLPLPDGTRYDIHAPDSAENVTRRQCVRVTRANSSTSKETGSTFVFIG